MTLVTLGIAWIGGLLAGLHMDVPPAALALFLASAGALTLLLKSRSPSLWSGLLCVVFLFALLRVELAPGPTPIQPSGALDMVSLRGQVSDDPELAGSEVLFVLQAQEIDRGAGWQKAADKVLVVARPPQSLVEKRDQPFFRYGDVLELKGRLQVPQSFGGFDYQLYLAHQGIHSTLSFPQVELLDEGRGNPLLARVHSLRQTLARHLDNALTPRQAALAQALLLGRRSDLPPDLKDDFRSSGTSHLLAVSGLHVGIILFLAMGASVFLLGRQRHLYLILPLGALWLYAVLTGMAPPVQRAAIMGSVYLCALALGRPRSALPALLLAAVVLAGIEPRALMQVSFQLSFAAVAGIALIMQRGSLVWSPFVPSLAGEEGWHAKVLRALAAAAAISLAATLATLPLVAFNFHQVPTLGIPATIMALPVMSAILVTSALAALGNILHPELGQVVGWFAWVPLSYLIELVHLIGRVPGSTFSIPGISNVLVLAYYAFLVLLVLSPRRLESLRRVPAWAGQTLRDAERRTLMLGTILPLLIIGMALVAAVLWFHVLTDSDGRLHVTFLDVGQGDAVFIETPDNRRVLVDGGPHPLEAARAVSDQLNFWERDLDLVVLTHGDEDHFRGLTEVVRRYRPDVMLEGGLRSQNPLYLELDRAIKEAGVQRIQAVRGQRIELGEAVRLEVLHPPTKPLLSTSADRNQ